MYLEFITPTQVDLRELFTLGLGSKRGVEGKIGHKGSGMKFTLALLHRLDSSLQVDVNGKRWSSVANPVTIRDREHRLIHLVDQSGESPALDASIDVSAGEDTWTHPWFALRELLQNCIDEGGHYLTVEAEDLGGPYQPGFCGTTMRVLLTPALEQAWNDRAKWFNERHPEVLYTSAQPGLYYHGFLIYPCDAWQYAYDVTALIERENLSEDRQLRNVDLSDLFRKIVKGSTAWPSKAYDLLIGIEVVPDVALLLEGTCRELRYGATGIGGFALGELEAAWVRAHGDRAAHTTQSEGGQEFYYAEAAGYKPIRVRYQLAGLLGRGDVVKGACDLMPGIEARLVTRKPTDLESTSLERLKSALKFTKRLRPDGCKVEIVTKRHDHDDIGAAGLAVHASNKVLLLESFVDRASTEELTHALVEEYMHLKSGASDVSVQFQRALVAQIAALLQPRTRATSEQFL